MNANEYNYGTDPKTGLPRRLVRDTALVQEEMDTNPKPKAVVFLREQTYIEETGVTVTDVSASYEVIKGEISEDVNGNALPKYDYTYSPETGLVKTPVVDGEGNPMPRDNGYDNIIFLSTVPVPFDTVLDEGIKEHYGISE